MEILITLFLEDVEIFHNCLKLPFFDLKIRLLFTALFRIQFWIRFRIRIRIRIRNVYFGSGSGQKFRILMDPDPVPDPDPQHCPKVYLRKKFGPIFKEL